MAKMTKTAAKTVAAQAVGAFTSSFSLDDLDAMNYDARRTEAKAIARREATRLGAAGLLGSAPEDVSGAFVDEFVEKLLGAWGSRTKQREIARRNWRTALGGITADVAKAQIVALVESMHIRGARVTSDRVEVERAWAVGATLYIRMETEYDSKIVNPDDDTQAVGRYAVHTELSWSGTSRSIAEATASVAVYNELIAAAAEIEAVMQRERIIWTWGVPEKTTTETVDA